MNKLVTASLLLFFLVTLKNQAFASSLDCKFKEGKVQGVESIQISDESLILNNQMEIPLEKSRVKCGNFGRQTRFDGSALGYQVVLKSCTTDAKLEGVLIDSINEVAADVLCNTSTATTTTPAE